MSRPPGMITVREAARMLGVNHKALDAEVRAGHLAAQQGTRWAPRWVAPADVEALRAAGRVREMPSPPGTLVTVSQDEEPLGPCRVRVRT